MYNCYKSYITMYKSYIACTSVCVYNNILYTSIYNVMTYNVIYIYIYKYTFIYYKVYQCLWLQLYAAFHIFPMVSIVLETCSV